MPSVRPVHPGLRPGSLAAQRSGFNRNASTRACASERFGRDAPVFTSDLLDARCGCEIAGPLRHAVGFPDLGLLRVLRPQPPPSVDDAPTRQPLPGLPSGAAVGFPCSPRNRSTGSVPSYAPAAPPPVRRSRSGWPPDRRREPAKEFPTTMWRVRAAAQPKSARLELVGCLERLSAAGSSRTPSRLACRARPVWQYQGAPSLSRLLPPNRSIPTGQAASSFTQSAATN